MQYTGQFSRDNQLKISYVSQNTSHLQGSLTDYAISSGIDESLFNESDICSAWANVIRRREVMEIDGLPKHSEYHGCRGRFRGCQPEAVAVVGSKGDTAEHYLSG